MTRPTTRRFDPPLTYDEVNKVYGFTTRLLERLGMSQWRLQLMTEPAPKTAYADIRPAERKHVGELRLGPGWMSEDLEAVRIPTLVHEVLHLTHRQLTDLVTDDLHSWVGYRVYRDFEPRWQDAIELWVDHMTQVLLGLLADDIAAWAEDLWGPDWRDLGSAAASDAEQAGAGS